MSEPSENALDDMWAVWAHAFAIAETLNHHGMTVSVIVDDVPRDPSAIQTARKTALDGLKAAKHIDTDRLEQRRKKRARSECYPFPDYR